MEDVNHRACDRQWSAMCRSAAWEEVRTAVFLGCLGTTLTTLWEVSEAGEAIV